MESRRLPSANSSTADENIATDHFSKREAFFAIYHRHQQWALPDSVIYYITKNPSTSNCYEKVIQSCKHFFIQKPLLVISEVHTKYEENEWDTWFDDDYVSLSKLLSKIWITDRIYINIYNPNVQNFFTDIFSKIYQNDAKKLDIFHQTVNFNDLILLTPKCEDIHFEDVVVMYDDDSLVALEKIVEALSNVKDFWYNLDGTPQNIVTPKTAKELIKIPHFLNLEFFILDNVPEEFDIDSFYDYIKTNKVTKIWLKFCNEISNVYKNGLQSIVNKILADSNRKFKAPCIRFPHNDQIALVVYSLS